MQKKITGSQVDVLLNDLADVDLTGAADGHVLTRAAGQWTSAPASGGGAGNRVHTFYLYNQNTVQFDGTAYGNWNISQMHLAPTPELVQLAGFYSDEFVFQENGSYRVALQAAVNPGTGLPDGMSAFGAELVLSSGNMLGANPSYHHLYGNPTYPGGFSSLAFSPTPGSGGSANLTWTDTFYMQVSAGANFKPYVYAYNYVNNSTTFGVQLIMTVEKLSDDAGA